MVRRKKLFYTATVLLLCIALFLVYALGGRPSMLRLFKKGAFGMALAQDPSFSYTAAKYNGGVAVFGKDGIAGVSNAGRKAWEIDFPVTSPLLYSSGRYILAAEEGGTRAILCAGGKIKQEVHTDAKILSGTVNARGVFALVTEERGYKGMVRVYAANGKVLYTWHSAAQNILSVALSADGRNLAVAVVNMQDLSQLCTVLRFNMKKTTPESLSVGDENLVANLVYNGNELVAIGDEALYYFKKDGTLRFRLDYAGRTLQRHSFYAGGVLSLAFWGGQAGGASALEFYDTNGKLKGSCPIDGAISAMDTFGNYAAVSTQSGLIIADKNGKVKGKMESVSSGQRVFLCGSRSRVFLLSGMNGSMYLI